MIEIKRLLVQASELDPLPPSTVRLAGLAGNPETSLDAIAEVIAYDPTLTMKLLRAANSAAVGGANPAITASDAVMRLGTAQVLALAVASGAGKFLRNSVSAYGLAEGKLWRHSVAAAVGAEIAPRFCGTAAPPETFTTALLHDIGKLVMNRFLNPEILGYIQRARESDGLDQLSGETAVLGVNCGEIGGLVAQHWQLPDRISQGIFCHHSPEQSRDVIADFTCLADHVADFIEAGIDGQKQEIALPSEVLDRVGLIPEKLYELCHAATARYEQVSRRYNAV